MKPETLNRLNLQVGPSGRAIAQPMETSLVDLIYEHLTMERNANAQYFAISLWFAEREFKGFAQFFKQECKAEQEHAYTFANYLIARGQTVVLDQLLAPKQEWNSIEEVISFSFQMEADVSSSLNQLYSIAERSSDNRTSVFLDPIIESQIASEDEFAHLLGKVKFANNDPSALFILDNELLGNNA